MSLHTVRAHRLEAERVLMLVGACFPGHRPLTVSLPPLPQDTPAFVLHDREGGDAQYIQESESCTTVL